MDFLVYITALWQDMISGVGAIVLIVLSLIALFATTLTMKKKVFKVSILTVVGFYVFVKCTCGPNFFDVRIMYPMAEKISQYIEKHGIPESLKDIPDLPYGLEGCVSKQTYYKFDNKVFTNIEVSLKKNAEFEVKDITCHFTNKKRHYFIRIDGTYDFKNSGSLMLEIKNDNSKTGIQYAFIINNKGQIYIDHKGNPYSSKTSGICNPMRQ